MSELSIEFPSAVAASDGLPPGRRGMAMFTYCIGLSMSVLDGNIANTALVQVESYNEPMPVITAFAPPKGA